MKLTLGNFKSTFPWNLTLGMLSLFSIYLIISKVSLDSLISLLIIHLFVCKTAWPKPISGGSFSNKLHLVCFPRSFLKSTSEPASCLEFLYCFLVRLHRWQTRTTFRRTPSREGKMTRLFACLNNRNTREGHSFRFIIIKIAEGFIQLKYMRRNNDGNISALSLFLECMIIVVLIKRLWRGVEDSYREFFAIFAFLCSLEVNSA